MKHPFLKIILALFACYIGVEVFYFFFCSPLNYIFPVTWDKFGYYLYLPATFIYHDIRHLGFAEAMMHKYNLSGYFYQAHLYSNGNYVLSYTLGLAILEFPFFCLGHVMAHVLGYPADGFSMPYQFAITVGCAFYSMVGIWFTYLNLSTFFSSNVVLVLITILVFATNFFYYSVFDGGMTHAYLFTMYAAALYLTIRWHREPKMKYAICLAIVIGMAIIMRPSEIVIALIPLLWNINGKDAIMHKYLLMRKNFLHLIVLVMTVVPIGMIQLVYWKYATGHWLYNSYKETGQSFNFLKPEIIKGLFSLSKGWLVLTPVMSLSIIGLFFLYRNAKAVFIPIAIYMLLNIYIVFSWCVWDYGGGFGSRPLVQSYAIALVPLGFALQFLFAHKLTKFIALLFIGFCMLLNLIQTTQYVTGVLGPGGYSKYTYVMLFGRIVPDISAIKSYQHLDNIKGDMAFDDTLSAHIGDKSGWLMPAVFILPDHDSLIYTGAIKVKGSSYIKISASGKFDGVNYNYPDLPWLRLFFENGSRQKIAEKEVKIEPLITDASIPIKAEHLGDPEHWHHFDFVVKVPSGTANLSLFAGNHAANNTMIDSIVIEQIGVK